MNHNILNRVTLTLVMNPDKAKELGVSRDSPLEERYAALKGLRSGSPLRARRPTSTCATTCARRG